MGKLNIAHHKSYHPYRLDNIEKVRRDEEEARLKEEAEDGRMALADSEARIALLRERAGLNKPSKRRKDRTSDEIPLTQEQPEVPQLELSDTRHINLFEDIEQKSMADSLNAANKARQKAKEAADEKGFALAPSEKDRNPWYTSRRTSQSEEEPPLNLDDPKAAIETEKRAREITRKGFHDPLTSITTALSRTEREKREMERRQMLQDSQFRRRSDPPRSSNFSSSSSSHDPLSNRLSRESSERERALALIARRKREAQGMDTPLSVSSVEQSEGGYGDVYNRQETLDAKRRWGDGRGHKRGDRKAAVSGW